MEQEYPRQQQQQHYEENKIVFQNEDISYEEVYYLNNTEVVTTDRLIVVVSSVLQEIIQETDKEHVEFITSFHGSSRPDISVKDYLQRILKLSNCSQECIIFAIIYIDRITQKHPKFLLNSLNIHRLLLTSLMLAAKFFDDRYYNNDYYSRIGGITNKEINQLEREFLHYISFKLYISPVLFFEYRQRLLIANDQEMN